MMNKKYLILLLPLLLAGCTSKSPESTQEPTLDIDRKWWKEGIIYQIYPRSFKDSDGDGEGDLRGIIEKLDYIQSLGVTMVWLNPFFDSPMVDNGYDVRNYREIAEMFGTMQDYDQLVAGLHERNIKLVVDIVVNHSSHEHQWFKQSRSSRDNPYRDYYHWWPAEDGKPPFRPSFFDAEGDAWQYDSLTNAYYLHYFADEQPDLKWENPKVRQEVMDIMTFWAEKGADGFRLDAFQYVSKDTTFPEMPEEHRAAFWSHINMGPNLHPYLREMHDQVLSRYDVFAVSEGVGNDFKDAHDLVDADRKELQMAYHFDYTGLVDTETQSYDLAKVKETFSKWDSAFQDQGWLSIYLANHDQSRLVSRFGNTSPAFRAASTQMLNTFILSMKGTPYTYYGDELGMTNIDFDTITQYNDVAAINGYLLAQSKGEDLDAYMRKLNFANRDNARTPMQWDQSKNAGFTTGTPWLPVNANYLEINVAAQEQDPHSVLNHFRQMTKLRNEQLALVYGDYRMVWPAHPQIYAYTRTLGEDQLLVLLNFSEKEAQATLPEEMTTGQIWINNARTNPISGQAVTLQPYQAVILTID